MQDKAGLLHGVFPAHAGMSLADAQLLHDGEGFPRSRGDEPAPGWLEAKSKGFSPLTRG